MAGDQLTADWGGGGEETPTASGPREYAGQRLVRAGGVRYWYDAAGRVVRQRRTRLSRRADVWHYTWDAEDRLVQVVTPDGTRWRYRYDPFGRRIAKQRLDGAGHVVEETTFTWDETQLVERSVISRESVVGSYSTTWEYDGLRPVAQIEGRPGDPEQSAYDRRFHAIATDLAGTPTHLVDEDGTVSWHARGTLWGVPLSGGDETERVPLRFLGQYADAETGWHYNLHRYYDPFVGRFTSPDPLGLGPAPNVFGYPHNPLVWSDALGLSPHPVGEIPYNSTDLSRRAFQARRDSGFWGADHNVAVARVRGLDELVVGMSGPGRHSEGHILQQLQQRGIDPRRVIDLYTERQPCSDCANLIADNMGQANVSWSVPYYNSPPLGRGDAQLMNDATAQLLEGMIARADGR
ncbi:RHS repeat-associated core domain-containing protein [Streptomyces sp. DSM 44915]|uniref:RHS repeat-associated core domain-containing protein n=1 Tax=Streptomyces chisholmiae TaxID=3075540 RepID=A0ABU2JX06_9ACTN|nr:RHS repeat-associated core domain-containing protein [Streptomyces sp. DSM 44915]MDT0269495.1 RHS repeat-associated core domain-containing protein [Streptomyces sp. DSM 44915]